jgi:hypothetical protein
MNTNLQMIMQKNIRQAKTKVLHGSMVWVSLWALLALSLVFPSSSNAQTTEIVTGQETTVNQLPTIDNFTTSGGTKHNSGTGTSEGCSSGNFCTAGKQGPGGTYSSTFDLKTNMTIDQINRGFTMDYGMDVESHSSNSRLASCVGGNVMQNSDCRDIFKLTVKLFDTGSVQKHIFEHEVELDFTGTRNFAFSQIIPENNYTDMTGTFDMFGIDAGFANKFFGPAFSAPFLSTTFDLVTLIETEVIDILNNTDILDQNTPESVEVVAIEVEVETQDGQQMASLELEVNTEMTLELEMPTMDMPTSTQEVQVEVAEVSAEIETEMSNVANAEPTTDQPVESTEGGTDTGNEQESEPEQTTEAEPREQEAESQSENESTGESQTDGPTESTPSGEEDQDADSTEPVQKPKPKVKVQPKKTAKQKAANKIVKKMGDKGRYDNTNQLKTLIIMNVLTDSKKFLVQPTIPQPTGFFAETKIPDAQLPENNAAAWMLMGGSNQLHDRLTASQYKEK